ncbi:amino acid permease [Thermodesulfobacteriota bacterium]
MVEKVKQGSTRNRFGTFGGVFTPSILTILGVIMFMRANFVIGQAGVIGALSILVIAKSITLFTSLSLAAISTNMRVRGGGFYFLISRVLGVEFGGAIGIALFFALTLSVPFYILGFAEALVRSYPILAPYFQIITLTTAFVLFSLAFFGAGWAIKTQYMIMFFLFLAIIAFLGGALLQFSFGTLQQNLYPGYTAVDPGGSMEPVYSFWIIFAIYFPAVTGIAAGVNMSGDLKDPGRSIPRGTLMAVGVGFLVYFFQIVLCGGAYERSALITMPYELLQDNAIFGWSILVTLGVVAATLSSALGSYLGAPRVLQAVSRDKILISLNFFSKGSKKGNEPRRALILTLVITFIVLLWAGNAAGGSALNGVAALITMFFLYSYGMINLAAFIEDFSGNPSFRPQFRYYHWSTALLGAIGCALVTTLINWKAALAAILIIALMLWYLKARRLIAKFGDARRGFIYKQTRNNLLRLRRMPEDSKNWRPNILVFSGNPMEREEIITYAAWIESKRGIVYLANVMIGDVVELAPRRPAALKHLTQFCNEKNYAAFPVVAVAEKLEQGISMLMQATAIGPIRPNLAFFGWSGKIERRQLYIKELRTASTLGMSLALIETKGLPIPEEPKRIDIWWRGFKNGALMLLIAFLLTENWEWENALIRVMRVVEKEEGRVPAEEALQKMIELARVEGEVEVVVAEESFSRVLHKYSADATCVILGFELPEKAEEAEWHASYRSFIDGMPTTILVNSLGAEDLFV